MNKLFTIVAVTVSLPFLTAFNWFKPVQAIDDTRGDKIPYATNNYHICSHSHQRYIDNQVKSFVERYNQYALNRNQRIGKITVQFVDYRNKSFNPTVSHYNNSIKSQFNSAEQHRLAMLSWDPRVNVKAHEWRFNSQVVDGVHNLKLESNVALYCSNYLSQAIKGIASGKTHPYSTLKHIKIATPYYQAKPMALVFDVSRK